MEAPEQNQAADYPPPHHNIPLLQDTLPPMSVEQVQEIGIDSEDDADCDSVEEVVFPKLQSITQNECY
jgi:hypothetical protein